jgi:hypothetical protein
MPVASLSNLTSPSSFNGTGELCATPVGTREKSTNAVVSRMKTQKSDINLGHGKLHTKAIQQLSSSIEAKTPIRGFDFRCSERSDHQQSKKTDIA